MDARAFYAHVKAVADEAKKIIVKGGRGKFYEEFSRRGEVKRIITYHGWQLIAAPFGMFAGARDGQVYDSGKGARSAADLRTAEGVVISTADATSDSTEKGWSDRDPNDYLSMAGTRACTKAFRSVLGFVPPLMGVEFNTPENTGDGSAAAPGPKPSASPPAESSADDSPPAQPSEAKTALERAQEASGSREGAGAEASKPETRQKLMAVLAALGFKDDQDKKLAFSSFLPGRTSLRETPEGELVKLGKCLKAALGDQPKTFLAIGKQENGDPWFALASTSDKQVLFPESGPVRDAAIAKLGAKPKGEDPF